MLQYKLSMKRKETTSFEQGCVYADGAVQTYTTFDTSLTRLPLKQHTKNENN